MSERGASRGVEVVRSAAPTLARRGDTFMAQRVGGELFGREGDPFLNLDHFRMSAPTFPPHPHAGFSAVTYLLPESPGGMANRDSRGDHSLIAPGGLHWTAAGAGIVHEEVPHPAGTRADGFQIFIRQPIAQETGPAMIHHVEPDAMPTLTIGAGAWVRVVAGRCGDAVAPFTPPSPLQILDVALSPGADLEWDNPWPGGSVTLYVFSGSLDLDGEGYAAPRVVVFARGTTGLHLTAPVGDARFAILAGEPLDVPSVSDGPFVLSSREAIADAVARYRSGGMGRID